MSSDDSLQSQLHSLLPQENTNSDRKTIKTSVLKIIHNTIIFDNTVFQIKNICAVELADLTTTYKIPIPNWYWFLLILGIILCFFYGIGIFLLNICRMAVLAKSQQGRKNGKIWVKN